MEKIPTIFDRDWEGNRGIIPKLVVDPVAFNGSVATEKVDGTNVRVTLRNGEPVRLEKRRNPDRIQKQRGIKEPWYVDAAWSYGMTTAGSAEDKYLVEALLNTSLEEVPDDEWSAEAIGPKIQGNPLGLESHQLKFFTRWAFSESLLVPLLDDVPRIYEAPRLSTSKVVDEWWFEALYKYLQSAHSRIGKNGIEGIVWKKGNDYVGKLKLKDFKF